MTALITRRQWKLQEVNARGSKVNVRVYARKILRLSTFSIFTYVSVRRQKHGSGNPPCYNDEAGGEGGGGGGQEEELIF